MLHRISPLLLAALLASCTGEGSPDKAPRKEGAAQGAGGAAVKGPAGPDAAAIDAALAKGVAWLRGKASDGMWKTLHEGAPVPSPAHTALALAPVARALSKAERAKDPLVKVAAGFLVSLQREDGALQSPLNYYDNYYTSAALMALSIVDDPAHAAAREKMKAFLLTLQRTEEGRNEGGFGYNKTQGADLSNAQFAIEALRSGGIAEDHPQMIKARAYLERVQNRSENAANRDAAWEVEHEGTGPVTVVPGNDGSAGYEPGVSKAGLMKLPDGTYQPRGYGSMTYALLKCYLLTGLPFEDDRVQAAVKWLGDNYGWEENPGFEVIARGIGQKDAPYWGLYYYYMTAAKALALTGVDRLETPDGPRDWRADLAAALLKRQAADGSWANDKSGRWEESDPLLVTAYAVLALQELRQGMK